MILIFVKSSDKLRANLLLKQYVLEVDLRHISLFNDELAHAIQDRPADILPLVRVLYANLDYLDLWLSSKMLLPERRVQYSSLWLVHRRSERRERLKQYRKSR